MITLYDFECSLPGFETMSPSVMKVRIALNYKNIPHRSVFIENYEIAQLAPTLNLPVNDIDGDSPARYKVPVIHDPSTGQTISDSTRIIAYLDRTYPQTPSILPQGSEALAAAFDEVVAKHMMAPTYPSMAPRLAISMDEKGRAYYGPSVERLLGMPIEEYFDHPELDAANWVNAESGFGVVDGILAKAELVAGETKGEEDQTGVKKLTYAEVAVGGILFYVKACLGDDEEHWRRLRAWDQGRWGRLYNTLIPYSVVPE
ncbi:hypothetical protein NMY22_g4099 [Coprinellus aureogranulatus]|nr:hypothetical protein NMY22_g4099 [Coprinellus aureogranulatus]